jgi:hypothetical protein
MNERQELFIEELGRSLGIISVALQKTGISRDEYEEWGKNKLFVEQINRINEMSLDYVENRLLNLINNGDLSAIQFYLKTKGQKRGYK